VLEGDGSPPVVPKALALSPLSGQEHMESDEYERELQNQALLQAVHARAAVSLTTTGRTPESPDALNYPRSRARELLVDFSVALPKILSASNTDSSNTAGDSIALVALGSSIYSNADFVSSVMKMNRLSLDRHLSAEDRRRVLFVSDQILP